METVEYDFLLSEHFTLVHLLSSLTHFSDECCSIPTWTPTSYSAKKADYGKLWSVHLKIKMFIYKRSSNYFKRVPALFFNPPSVLCPNMTLFKTNQHSLGFKSFHLLCSLKRWVIFTDGKKKLFIFYLDSMHSAPPFYSPSPPCSLFLPDKCNYK